MKHFILLLFTFLLISNDLTAQEHSTARRWNDALLEAIRGDFARPTVHARNLFHTSIALYDSWAIYDDKAKTYLLGKTVNGFECPFDGIIDPIDKARAIDETMSYAAYRLLRHRFQNSPSAAQTIQRLNQLMIDLGHDAGYSSINYSGGSPAALGNYIGQCLIEFGFQDGSNEMIQYQNAYYLPSNPSLIIDNPGNDRMVDPNRWQPLTLEVFIDQGGNPIPGSTPEFLSPEWGQVSPFALKEEDREIYQRDGGEYWVYHNPGAPPYLGGNLSEEYKWGFALVSAWSSHLDPNDGVMWDISPASIGNIQQLPETIEELRDFYDFENGGDPSKGHTLNPYTGQPYVPQMVPRGDYARILAEFWADGPDSETPPGHWFTILNYVNDHPLFEKRYRGQGEILDDLEWDVKAYLMMGGAMHDAAITAWGIKGWYDYPRPVSTIRYMADQGQSSDSNLPNYNPAGLPLVEGYIELVQAGDPLAGSNGEHINKVKVYAWKGPNYINNPDTDVAGVDWILAENWWPYQRPSFVTPPFAGYVSGHSTYSRAAAEILTKLTGDPFFPGGIGEFVARRNEFLVFEDGPSQDITLQWATYRDASDQTSLSRIWGGIHPPVDDIPGRKIGMQIAEDAFALAEAYFFNDNDNDGFHEFIDCNDDNPDINQASLEVCDNIDNDCDGLIDEGLELISYFRDNDKDGFGDINDPLYTCFDMELVDYVRDSTDCDDTDATINPLAEDIPRNGIDENCSGGDATSTEKLFYPNPLSTNELTINFDYAGIANIYIIDASGRLVGDQVLTFTDNYTTVNFEGYGPGVYFIRLFDKDGNELATEKIVKYLGF